MIPGRIGLCAALYRSVLYTLAATVETGGSTVVPYSMSIL